MLEIVAVPCLFDNYAWLVHDTGSGLCAVVDPSESVPVDRVLEERGWSLSHILNTHHHWDHIGGNEDLKASTGATVVGSEVDRGRVDTIDVGLEGGEVFELGEARAEVLTIPGHTRGHVAFHFPGAVFVGDTMFSLGCGRLFEGTAEQMWTSLCRLRTLPATTRVYCGHEYTQANARFALTIEPANRALQERAAEVDRLRAARQATVPTTIAQERAANPFLRADEPAVAAAVGLEDASASEVFAGLRRWKDSF